MLCLSFPEGFHRHEVANFRKMNSFSSSLILAHGGFTIWIGSDGRRQLFHRQRRSVEMTQVTTDIRGAQ
jgi:hypothetical protein